ncbi:fibronectin type III domain-containing protein 3B-like [Carassius gibelio]|uniref:fibronectin type III domain-containing protein 3B-like n=1 Tax=Carassius gibelio TaxID=101364 RepID=UPI002277DF51|nr:fibronectin type III domain-containing protein 3B-like [Carassius gibelio]
MMSPNGSIPPIHVPPGYISQVLEDNTGVRRVVVTPHSECYPPSYSPALSPSHHIHHPYLTHPHFIPTSHTSYYPPVSPGDMPPHQFYQHRLPPIYPEEIIPLYNVSSFMGHEEYCKPPPKKLKQPVERTGLSQVTSSLSSSYKNTTTCTTTASGYSKSHSSPGGGGGGSPGSKRPDRRARGSPKHSDTEPQDLDVNTRRVQAVPSGLDKPQVSKVQSRSALVSWTSVSVLGSSGRVPSCSYELQLKDNGRDGKYKVVYSGEELQYTLTDLRPATDYHVRVSTVCNSVKGPSSDARAFTTHGAPPDTPLPPRLSHRTKSSLTLQWKPPADNGSKITNYVLEWDEGKKNSIFREYYVGHQRHCKVMGLCPAVGYTFRVAALNDIGASGFSTEVVFNTTGSLPQTSLPPRLAQAGPSWVMLEWTRPNSCSVEEVVTYTLEMQDESKGLDFQTVYSGLELNRKVETLKRNAQYKFRPGKNRGGVPSLSPNHQSFRPVRLRTSQNVTLRGSYHCREGREINVSQLCDFKPDCPQGDDEGEHCRRFLNGSYCSFGREDCGWQLVPGRGPQWRAHPSIPQSLRSSCPSPGALLAIDSQPKGQRGSAQVRSPFFFYPLRNAPCMVKFWVCGSSNGVLSLWIIENSTGPEGQRSLWNSTSEANMGKGWKLIALPLFGLVDLFYLKFIADISSSAGVAFAVDNFTLSMECFLEIPGEF